MKYEHARQKPYLLNKLWDFPLPTTERGKRKRISKQPVFMALHRFLNSQGASEALTWQRLLWQKQLENVLRLKHRQISITPADTNDMHFEMPEAHTAS